MPVSAGRSQTSERYLTDGEIEERSQSLIFSYGLKYGLVNEPPVPVEQIAENYLGLRCLVGSADHSSLDTVVTVSFFERLIMINPRFASRDSYSFDVAHGIGHWLLHRSDFLSLPLPIPGFHRDSDITCKQGTVNMREDEALRFAAALVVPASLLRPLLRNLKTRTNSDIRQLAGFFDAKESVIRARLETLGLTSEQETAQLPLEITGPSALTLTPLSTNRI